MTQEPRDQATAPGVGADRPDAGATRRDVDRDADAERARVGRGPQGADGAAPVSESDAAHPTARQVARDLARGEVRDDVKESERRGPDRRGEVLAPTRPSSVRRAIRDELASDAPETLTRRAARVDSGALRSVIELEHVHLAFDRPILE